MRGEYEVSTVEGIRGRDAVQGKRGRERLPPFQKLHLFNFDALIRAHFNAAHASNALSRLVRVGFAVGAHLIHLYRTDVDALTAAGAAIHVDID
jgi:hypothetical protein